MKSVSGYSAKVSLDTKKIHAYWWVPGSFYQLNLTVHVSKKFPTLFFYEEVKGSAFLPLIFYRPGALQGTRAFGADMSNRLTHYYRFGSFEELEQWSFFIQPFLKSRQRCKPSYLDIEVMVRMDRPAIVDQKVFLANVSAFAFIRGNKFPPTKAKAETCKAKTNFFFVYCRCIRKARCEYDQKRISRSPAWPRIYANETCYNR